MSDGIDALCDVLRSVGIELVFGVPGTQNVSLFDGFRRHRVRTVLATDELAASFMANGYFRATGKVAALVTIPGPGFTYALTGIAEARLDSAGLLYLVGMPATAPGRVFQLQAIDQREIAAPLVKGCFDLSTAGDSDRVVREAHALALSGEPGPVMVQIDMRRMGVTVASAPETQRVDSTVSVNLAETAREQLVAMFQAAHRPVLYLGQGAYESAVRLEQMAIALRIPVLTTPSARGIIAEDSPLVLGFDPLRGHVGTVNEFLDRSDLIVALGCKLGHNGSAGFELRLGGDRLVHVDASPAVPGANYPTRLPIIARVEQVIGCLEARQNVSDWTHDELYAIRASVRERTGDEREPVISGGRTSTPSEFFAWLRTMLPRDAIVITDSGQHQILTRRYFEVRSPRGLICPSDFQSMGFGLPAAIGAKLGVGERPVVAIVGDGGFLMSGLELLTARRENASLVVFVFNDGYLNQIRMQQWLEFGHAHAVELLNPDFAVLASSLGIDYLRLDQAHDEQVARALHGKGLTLIEVLVGDSLAQRALPVIARAKGAARTMIRPGLGRWLKERLRR